MNDPIILTEEQIDAIAERAANKVYERFAMHVGNRVIRGASYVIGVAVVAVATWLGANGLLK